MSHLLGAKSHQRPPKRRPETTFRHHFGEIWARMGDFGAHLGPLVAHVCVYYAFCAISCARGAAQEFAGGRGVDPLA